MRRLALILALLLLGTVSLPAQVNSPYRYGHRWNIALFGGPLVFGSDCSGEFSSHFMTESLFSPLGGVALGYHFTDGHGMRLFANYSNKTGLLPPEHGFYPYNFRSVQVFGDYLLNMEGLGENYTAFVPQMYVGLGAGYTFGFRTSWMDEELDALLSQRNLVPAFHLGTVLEYGFRNGLGLFFDLGGAFYLDTYNGQAFMGFPFDFEIDAVFGLIYRFKSPRLGLR